MTLRHLRIFIELYQNNGNVSKTAEALSISQSSISRALSELEEYYQIVLFDRVSKRLYLTEAGETFYNNALGIVRKFDALSASFHESPSGSYLRIGCANLFFARLLSDIVAAFSLQYPDVPIKVYNTAEVALREMMVHGELDVALIQGMIPDESILNAYTIETEISIITSPKFWGDRPRTISAMQLAQLPLLLKEQDCSLRLVFDSTLYQKGLVSSPLWESCHSYLLVEAALRGMGVAVIYKKLAEAALESGALIELTVPEISPILSHWSTGIIYSRKKEPSPALDAFINLCVEHIRENM